VDALTLREAARRAGVSPAAPYRHFADKQALLAAVAEEGFRTMVDEMRRASGEHATEPLAALRAVGLAYVGFAIRHPSHFRVMFGREVADRSSHPALGQAAAAAFELLAEGVAGCQRAGLLRAGDARALAVSASMRAPRTRAPATSPPIYSWASDRACPDATGATGSRPRRREDSLARPARRFGPGRWSSKVAACLAGRLRALADGTDSR
jgi:AcrR family transcriptional regulator